MQLLVKKYKSNIHKISQIKEYTKILRLPNRS